MNQTKIQYILTINNPDSVVDVFIDRDHDQIVEFKRLNGNRTKRYDYPVDSYLNMVRNFKGVDSRIKKFLNIPA